jgi:ribonucleotide reductase alpha subunit
MVQIDESRDSLITDAGKRVLDELYLLKGETYQQAFARAAVAFSDDDAHAQRLYDYASKQWFMFSSPLLGNGGTKRGLPISCNLSQCDDSRRGLIANWEEMIFLATNGAGIGSDYSMLRSDGTETSKGSESQGVIPWTSVADRLVPACRQGKTRRASHAIYLDISHPEIVEFIGIRNPTGGDDRRKCLDTHIGVNIPDAFMEAVRAKADWGLVDPHTKEVVSTIPAHKLWAMILEARMGGKGLGEPYLHFIDTSNKGLNPFLRDKGFLINSSNLCVAPETMLMTSSGQKQISDLENKKVEVWNGEEWSEVTVRKTNDDAELMKVKFSDGSELVCTPYHRFPTVSKYGQKTPEIVETKDLVPGMKLEKWSMPDWVEGTEEYAGSLSPYSQGFYAAEGNNGYSFSWVYDEKGDAIKRLDGEVKAESSFGRRKWEHGIVDDKFYVPLGCSLTSQLDWFSGYLDGDGTVVRSVNHDQIQFTSVDKEFLDKIRLMLVELGVQSSMSLTREEGYYNLPDGQGGLKPYLCSATYRVCIGGEGTRFLLESGLSCSRLAFTNIQEPQRSALRFVAVSSVEKLDRRDATYCFTEEKRGRGMFNGIVTMNCTEIFLPTNPDYTAVCCLSSVNAAKYDEWYDDPIFIEDIVRMLDNALTVYVKDAPPELWRAVKSAMYERSIGIGLMGFHTFLQNNMVPFESAAAISWSRRFSRTIKEQAEVASRKLAKERGEPEGIKGSGMRNAHLIAIAPNAKSSIICGEVSPSIEPLASNAYKKMTDAGWWTWKNPALDSLIASSFPGQEEEIWKSVISNGGSVQHLDLPQEVKDVFKTAYELDQNWIVEHAAKRQEFIDQGQSVNLFFNEGVTDVEVDKVHGRAWKKGLKSLYYCRVDKKKNADNLSAPVERQLVEEAEINKEIIKNAELAEQRGYFVMEGINAAEEEEEDDCIACQG